MKIFHDTSKKIKKKWQKALFDKKFMRCLCSLILIPSLKKKVWKRVEAFIDNYVYRVNTKGKKTRLCGFSKIPGLKFNLGGKDNQIHLYTPLRFEKSQITLFGEKNTIIIEKPNKDTIVGIFVNVDMKQKRNNRLLHIKRNFSGRGVHFILTGHRRKIVVGENCLFSSNIKVRTTDQHHIYDAQTGELLNPEKDVVIGDHVWCAKDVTILKGSVVPPNSVIGMGSIYTASSEKEPDMEQKDGNIYVGIPAKCVKKHIRWEE